MKRFTVVRPLILFALLVALASPARAGLDVGERAPDFTTDAALGGKVYKYSLSEYLKRGPVVLYFFLAAYSHDCSLEAHEFAEAMAEIESLGATVVGVSRDDIGTLIKFSVQACQSRFPVAADESGTVTKAFDAVMRTRPDFANRTSYVIAPDGKIVFQYTSLNPVKHVERMLGALRELRAAAPKP